MTEVRSVVGPDGRSLAYAEYGDADGPPVFLFHGTPGSRLDHDPYNRPGAARVIVPDRPGYGLSDPHPGRRLVDWPADVVAIADALGFDRFSVAGISGGGPHALACAALVPDRLHRVGVVCGVGPLDRPGATEGMLPMNVMFFETARADRDAVMAVGDTMAAAIQSDADEFLEHGRADLPAVDRATIDQPEVRAMLRASMTEAVRQGGRAFAEEMCLFAHPWGFDLEAIGVGVLLWQGSEDRNVPPSHAEYMARTIPSATLTMLPGEGHFSLAIHHAAGFIRQLLA